jgi:hypothetical protein
VAPSWIITLHAGASPALIPEPRGLMAQYDFFTSRTVEDGRERFRLHLGFFDDLPTAKSVLRVARETCPAAWLVPADHYQVLRRVPKEVAKDTAPPPELRPPLEPRQTVELPRALARPRVPELRQAPELALVPSPVPLPAADAALHRSGGSVLEADEVFALLGGAAHLLAGVLPEVHLDEPGKTAAEGASAAAVSAAAPAAARRATDDLVRDVSRFIVEEWQPEARRPQRPPAEHAWYARFRRGKGRSRSRTAAS